MRDRILRYKGFRIKNFKGIKDTYVDLLDGDSASVFAFVGLNESGKTTILEAIHSFSPDAATSRLVGGDEESGVPHVDKVPRHLISYFSGDVSVTAYVLLNDEDKVLLRRALLLSQENITIDHIPDVVEIERHQRFKDGDFTSSFLSLRTPFKVKTGKQKKFREPTRDENAKIKFAIYNRTPDISYFPTFVFNFPSQIFLSDDRGGEINEFYCRVFQDILDKGGHGHTIENSLVRRIRTPNLLKPWAEFLSKWSLLDDKDKIQHVLDQASETVTSVVFGRWNRIFGEEVKGKEILIQFDAVEGEAIEQKGVTTSASSHDIAIRFLVRDGTRRFSVNDRSLGFRWFFSFMLFTQFRVSRGTTRPLLFLFDEPASNLHAAAQQKLIECFPELTTGENALAYTTHSHYMIEPKWLEQTFIVTNRSDEPIKSIIEATSLTDESLDVKATRYRNFISENSNKTSYFQPILDRLEVVPSKFDIKQKSVILEGKSDYYILRYGIALLKHTDISLIPAFGAGTFGALVSLSIAWNIQNLFLLDGDKEGIKQKKYYMKDYSISSEKIVLLSDIDASFTDIESIIDLESKKIISKKLGLSTQPNKTHILRFFQENLASGRVSPLSKPFSDNCAKILNRLSLMLNS